MNNKAFTLIELLVVISIIGVLSSIVLVSFSDSRDKARLAKAQQFDAQVSHALGAYAVGIWRFEEGSGTTIHDESGYGNDGTFHGSPTPVFPAGVYAGTTALEFDGVNDYVQFPYNAVAQSDAITIEYWIKLTSDPSTSGANNWRRIFSPSGSGAPCDLILEQNRTTCFTVRVGGIRYRRIGGTFSSEKLTVGKWAHLVYIYDPSTGWGYAYKNAKLSREGAMAPGPGNLDSSGNGWRISWPAGTSTPSGNGAIPGVIDDFRIYSEVLGITEIQQHFATSAPSHGIAIK